MSKLLSPGCSPSLSCFRPGQHCPQLWDLPALGAWDGNVASVGQVWGILTQVEDLATRGGGVWNLDRRASVPWRRHTNGQSGIVLPHSPKLVVWIGQLETRDCLRVFTDAQVHTITELRSELGLQFFRFFGSPQVRQTFRLSNWLVVRLILASKNIPQQVDVGELLINWT